MHRPTISGRAKRQFLRLAAVTLAVGGDMLPANATDLVGTESESRLEATEREDSASTYRHEFELAADSAATRVRVTGLSGIQHTALSVAGPCAVGPFPAGAYSVSICRGGPAEVHLLRIDPGTENYLHFVA
jgi:hypothetical protein